MIDPRQLFEILTAEGLTFYTGVPDSLLKDFCAYVTDNTPQANQIIAANEGGAVALASGHYLATGKPAVVYLQNSGLGNCVNPLVSLADPQVYSIPMLLLIGWRGEPGKKDEPQHVKQGRITISMLECLEIPYEIIDSTIPNLGDAVKRIVRTMISRLAPVALVVREGTFEPYKLHKDVHTNCQMNREDALHIILAHLTSQSDIVVSTTGKTSREIFEYREHHAQGHGRDFLTVGSMGHASQIALGIAMQKSNKSVYCIDGDGAVIMHMGSLAIIGAQGCANYKHIVINNGSHDSVGGQPTVGFSIDIRSVASSLGYKKVLLAETREELNSALTQLKEAEGPALLEVKVNKGARSNLGRPTTTPIQNKLKFMEYLQK